MARSSGSACHRPTPRGAECSRWRGSTTCTMRPGLAIWPAVAVFGFNNAGRRAARPARPAPQGRLPRRLQTDTLDATRLSRQGTRVDQELVAYLDRRFSELKSELSSELTLELRGEITTSAAWVTPELRGEIAASAAETRRHFDVVAERLMDKIQLVGEGVIGVDQKLDRFRGEVAEEFHRVDRRLLRLEARASG